MSSSDVDRINLIASWKEMERAREKCAYAQAKVEVARRVAEALMEQHRDIRRKIKENKKRQKARCMEENESLATSAHSQTQTQTHPRHCSHSRDVQDHLVNVEESRAFDARRASLRAQHKISGIYS